MRIKLSEKNIRTGEDRAFRLFQDEIALGRVRWIPKAKALRYRGVGRQMVRRVFAVARHVEGSKLSRSLGERGVDSVSLSSVRTALSQVGNGLISVATHRRSKEASITGGSLARYIQRTRTP